MHYILDLEKPYILVFGDITHIIVPTHIKLEYKRTERKDGTWY